MTYAQARAIARRHDAESRFLASYRQIKPWWAFWVSEHDAASDSLWDCDINPSAVHFPIMPPPKKP